MKLKNILEAKYSAPVPKQERLPDHLRTKRGIKQHMNDWKTQLRELLWNRWWQTGAEEKTEEDLEMFIGELESDPEVQRIFAKIPHDNMLDYYRNAYDDVVSAFQVDAMEDIEYNQQEDNW